MIFAVEERARISTFYARNISFCFSRHIQTSRSSCEARGYRMACSNPYCKLSYTHRYNPLVDLP